MGKPKVDEKINAILNSIKKKNNSESDKSNELQSDEAEVKVKVKPSVPRGKPKSGRVWKSPKQKFSSIKKTKGAHQTFAEKEALRQKLNQIKQASREIQEQRERQKEHAKQRRRENLKRAEENRLKSEIVQVITNSAKIKRMKKKQLRFIEKRDTTKVQK